MAFCTKCGTELPAEAKACPNCGTMIAEEGVQPNPAPQPEAPASSAAADHTAEFDAKDIADNKVMAVLAYIGILVLIPLLVSPAKDSPFVRYHVNFGLILWIGGMISSLLSVLCVGVITGIICLVLAIMGIVNAANGTAKDLPIIGKIRLLK